MILNVRDEKVRNKNAQMTEKDWLLVGIFPEPEHDPVIQIASMVIRQGEKQEFIKTVFTLGTCANIAGVEVIECKTEQQLLEVGMKEIEHRFICVFIHLEMGRFSS